MYNVKLAYFPIGRQTFDLEIAQQYFSESLKVLREFAKDVQAPKRMITSIEELTHYMDTLSKDVDLIVFQMLTFADASFITHILPKYPQRVLVWSVREPSTGGRLRLNSLTGGNSTCHTLQRHERAFDFLLGNPDEEEVVLSIGRICNALETKNKLQKLTVGVVGEHPDGFYFSGTDEAELFKTTGVRVEYLDLYKLFKQSLSAPEEQWRPMIDQALKSVRGLQADDESVVKFAKFSSQLKKYLDENGIRATAIRCWPDFFTEFGAAACSTLSHLTEDGIVSACESDIHGAVTMYIQQSLSGGTPPYLGDLVHIDEENNSVVFWHCGAGAYSLANPTVGAQAGVHPNRKIGFTLEFGLKPGRVTIARLGKSSTGYRLLIMKGEALDSPQKFSGTTVEVRLNGDVKQTVQSLMLEGFEPHYSIVYADIVEELKGLGRLLNIPTVIYE